MKFPTNQGIVKVQGDQQLSWEWMKIAIKGKTQLDAMKGSNIIPK